MTASTLLLTAASLSCFAANALLARGALGAGAIDAGSYTVVRMAAGAALLVPLALGRGGLRGSRGSAAALFVYATAFSLSCQRIPVSVGALALFLAVQVVMVGTAVWRGDRPGRLQWVGMAAALSGLAILALPGAHAPDPLGTALMLLSGAAWGVYTLRARAGQDPVAANAGNFARSLPALLAFGALEALGPGGLHATGQGLLLAGLSGALGTGGGYILWYLAAPRLGPTRAATVQTAVPVMAGAGGVALLGEPPSLRLLAAAAAIVGGILLAARPSRARPGASR